MPAHARFPFQGYERVLDEVVRLGHFSPHLQVLDLGIGNLAARLVRAMQIRYDFSTQMLMKARAKLPETVLVRADLLSAWSAQLQ